MEQFKKYSSEAEYSADASTRAAAKKTIVSVVANSIAKYDGYGVFVEKEFVKDGDLVVYDATHGVRFIDGDTLPATKALTTTMLSALGVKAVAVVFKYKGRTVGVDINWGPYQRWAAGFQIAIYGIDTANGGSFTIAHNATTNIDVAYSAGSTLSEVAATIKTACAAALYGSDYWTTSVNEEANAIVLTMNYYLQCTSLEVVNASAGEHSRQITPLHYQNCNFSDIGVDITQDNVIHRKSGLATYYAGINYERLLERYRTNGNSNTKQPVKHSEILKEAVFTAEDNPLVYEYYNGSYEAYIADQMAKRPYSKGMLEPKQHTFGENTRKLAAITYLDINGEQQPAFPFAHWAVNYDPMSIGVESGTHIGAGDWFHMDADMGAAFLADRKIDGSDIINRTLAKVGATWRPQDMSVWTETSYNVRTSMIVNSYGNLTGYSRYGSDRTRAVSAFD